GVNGSSSINSGRSKILLNACDMATLDIGTSSPCFLFEGTSHWLPFPYLISSSTHLRISGLNGNECWRADLFLVPGFHKLYSRFNSDLLARSTSSGRLDATRHNLAAHFVPSHTLKYSHTYQKTQTSASVSLRSRGVGFAPPATLLTDISFNGDVSIIPWKAHQLRNCFIREKTRRPITILPSSISGLTSWFTMNLLMSLTFTSAMCGKTCIKIQ